MGSPTLKKELASKVAIIKGESPKENVIDGFNKLGGLHNYIDDGDQVFIKFNLTLPNGFPTNSNFDVLETIIKSCKEIGVKKIYIGSFPLNGLTIKAISDILDLERYFKNLGAELTFLDNSEYYLPKKTKIEQLKVIKNRSFKKVEINNKEFEVPRIILDSDKLISINQVNVDPLFKYRLSLLNSYSIVPQYYQHIKKKVREGKDYFYLDQYKQDLISNVIDVYSIKKPDLVINDLFYVLEGAGPIIYKDSSLKKTGIMVIGDNVITVDLITLQLLNLDSFRNDLYAEAKEIYLDTLDSSKIKIFGEKPEDIKINLELCPSKLTDINVQKFSIKSGRYCSGCYKQAYHLLNLIKTIMIKDLKYLSKNSFLIGEKPLESEVIDSNIKKKFGNIILFGDCAINSTKDRDFRKNNNNNLNIKNKELRSKKNKEKRNKDILEIPGCPPTDLFHCLLLLMNFFGKRNVPTLYFYYKTILSLIYLKFKKRFEMWEVL